MKQRLFVDLDGTCAKWNPVAEEQLYEKGYYRNLEEYPNVVAAVNHIVEAHPEIDVYILSKYLTNSDYALAEKQEWVQEHLPGIDSGHQIFVPIEMDKRDMIPNQIRENDFLLDDYTKNFENWQPPARGIKLLNGINHTNGTWQHDRISLVRNPKDLAEAIIRVMEGREMIKDRPPQQETVHNNEAEYTLYDQAVDQIIGQMEIEDLMPE